MGAPPRYTYQCGVCGAVLTHTGGAAWAERQMPLAKRKN